MAPSLVFYLGVLFLFSAPCLAFLGNNVFRTGDPRLFPLFCVSDPSDLSDIGMSTLTHQDIITEGVKRSILAFFGESRHSSARELPEDASLSEVYQAHYGECSSPERFLTAVQDLIDGAADMDTLPLVKDDPRLHFDAEYLNESQALLGERFGQIITTILSESKFPTARRLMGKSLHTMNNFYTHTNWIELGNPNYNPDVGYPGRQLHNVSSPGDDTCSPSNLTTDKLTSGYNTGHQIDGEEVTAPSGKCYHSNTEVEVTTTSAPTTNSTTAPLTSPTVIVRASSATTTNPSTTTSTRASSTTAPMASTTTVPLTSTPTPMTTASEIPTFTVKGINKDTTSECFSPHAELHKNSANLAIESTFQFLEHIRSVAGNEVFAQLFDLSLGSALAIAIDVSPSMDEEIEAVKSKVAEIVLAAEETGSTPSLFVLVPFDDPAGPVTKTTNPAEFLKAVNELYTYGSGTELFWSAVQLSLTNTIPYSNIVVFTDEPGDDPQLKDGVLALAESLKTKVSVVYSGGSVPTAHKDLCSATSGLCIEFNKVDADQIVDLLSSSAEASKALLSQYTGLRGSQNLEFKVDNTFLSKPDSVTEIHISGSLSTKVLKSPSGLVVDMNDQTSIDNSGLSINIIVNLDNALVFDFKPNAAGIWFLFLDSTAASITSPRDRARATSNPMASTTTVANSSSTTTPRASSTTVVGSEYSVSILASCTFTFLADIRYLDIMTNHPNLRKLPGRPVVGSAPTLSITMAGVERSSLKRPIEIHKVSFVDSQGIILEEHNKTNGVMFENDFIIQTTYPDGKGLTSTPFYIRLEGTDSSEREFWRTFPTLISAASTKVEVTASTSKLEATPGNSTSAKFMISNYGPFANIDINVIDDKGYFVSISNSVVSLNENETAEVTATFEVPLDAVIGSVSTITVTASSQLDLTYNSAHATLIVVGTEMDSVPPSCLMSSVSVPCFGADPVECGLDFWDLEAVLWDEQSGLGSIRTEPAGKGNLTLDGFVPGTTANITAKYSSSCCNTQTTLIGVDMLGNVDNSCSVQFELRNCSILRVVSVGSTWIAVEWSKPCDFDAVRKYEFTGTNLLTGEKEFIHTVDTCYDFKCKDNITYQNPCVDYKIELSAFHIDEAAPPANYSVRQTKTTESKTSEPRLFQVSSITNTNITLSWEKPLSNFHCVDHYHVCWNPLPVFKDSKYSTTPTCKNTTNTSIDVGGLDPCTYYHFTVSAVTPMGKMSRTSILEESTDFDHPGPPEKVSISETGVHHVSLQWQTPSINPACVKGYAAFCYEESVQYNSEVLKIKAHKSHQVSKWDNWISIHGLHECTNYTCEVESLAYDHWMSSSSNISTITNSSKPSQPSDVEVTFVGAREAVLVWSAPDSGSRCVNEYMMVWKNKENTNNGSRVVEKGTLEATIAHLFPCSDYSVSVQAVTVSTNGDWGNTTLRTSDVAPGIVQNLYIDSTTQEGFEARWQLPLQDPQCSQEFITTTIGPHKKYIKTARPKQKDDWLFEVVDGLECGSLYTFEVSGSSLSGFQGPISSVVARTKDC